MDGKLLINEVASLLGVEPSAIRYWERKGLLHLQRDYDNDYRYFDSKALLEVLDIVFFRKLQLPIKALTKHLTGTIDERKEILSNAKKEVEELIVKLQQADEALRFRLDCLQEIEQLQIQNDFSLQQEMQFSKIESLNLLHEKHTQQYLTEPSHFVLLFEGEKQQKIREGIIVNDKETIDKYIIWQKNETTDSIFGGLLVVNTENHRLNSLNSLRKKLSIDPAFTQVIAQYLSSGKEENQSVDYYKCWFIKNGTVND